MNPHRFTLLCLLCTVFACGCTTTKSPDRAETKNTERWGPEEVVFDHWSTIGKEDARRDIKHGKLILKGYPRSEAPAALVKEFRQKYATEIRLMPEGVEELRQEDGAYACGYNLEMFYELRRRYGIEVIQRLDVQKYGAKTAR